jgi:hypothetical protein
LIFHFAEDMGRYEAKIALALTMMPFMDRSVVGRLMKVIEGVLGHSASESMMRNNINPLRCAMMLFRLIRDAKEIFSYSEHTAAIMEEKLQDQMRNMLEMYNDPDELQILLEGQDFDGNDIFWYLDEYDMYKILDCRIMDRVIQNKWNGKYDITHSFLDGSIAYTLL